MMQNHKAFSGLRGKLRNYPFEVTRTQLLIFALTLIAFGFAMGGLDSGKDPSVAAKQVFELSLPERFGLQPPAGDSVPAAEMETVDGEPLPGAGPWEDVRVKPGQSLGAIFRQQGFSAKTLHEILALNDDTRKLKRIRPGDVFEFQRHADKSLKRMRYAVDDARYLVIEHNGEKAFASTESRDVITETTETSGVINSSLFLAGKQAGLSDAMVMKFANLFGWDVDFVLDIRAGDRFYLVYEKVYRDGAFLRDGEIVGATFINQGEKFQAIRFDIDGVSHYFAPDGRNMRKAFLRAPLNFSYVSSNFNPKRYHPILKRIKAHNGIDYRAPRGTPVYAAGDGKVIESAYGKFNGNYVVIQHANSIVTKYLHFSSSKVRKGDRVKQGQVIGYVGSTGLAQAPHLHYEFVVNGVHRNPRTFPLPKAEALQGDRLAAFLNSERPVLARLERLESVSLYAANSP